MLVGRGKPETKYNNLAKFNGERIFKSHFLIKSIFYIFFNKHPIPMYCMCQLPKQNEQRRSDTETRKIGPGNVAISNTTSLYNFQIYKW